MLPLLSLLFCRRLFIVGIWQDGNNTALSSRNACFSEIDINTTRPAVLATVRVQFRALGTVHYQSCVDQLHGCVAFEAETRGPHLPSGLAGKPHSSAGRTSEHVGGSRAREQRCVRIRIFPWNLWHDHSMEIAQNWPCTLRSFLSGIILIVDNSP
jgi:hypothetical protein